LVEGLKRRKVFQEGGQSFGFGLLKKVFKGRLFQGLGKNPKEVGLPPLKAIKGQKNSQKAW